MRLGGCILLELAVGASLLAGTGAGAYFGGRILLRETGGQAYAAPSDVPRGDAIQLATASIGPLPLEAPPDPPAPQPERPAGYFHGVADEELLAPLRMRTIERVKFNRGGSSISLRIDFEGGGRAAFKPDQINLQTVPRKEVAAYRMSRLLGLSAVAPAAPREFKRADLIAHVDPGSRDVVPRILAEVEANPDGDVKGAVMWWIPEIRDTKLDGYPIDGVDGMVLWKRWLQAKKPIPEKYQVVIPQISNMVAFDYLISNSDRWSGSNAKSSPDGALLYFMDNALSFGPNPEGHSKVTIYLKRVQKFSRALYGALRALDEDVLRKTMTEDAAPYERLLTDEEIAGVLHRRDRLIAYIDELCAAHGRDEVLVFP